MSGVHRFSALGVIVVASVGLAACGPATPSHKATPSATPRSPTPSPTATPGPDTQTVSVLATGVGSYALAAIPVAILRNDASAHAAESVVVHFVTRRSGGGRLGELDSVPVNIVAGEMLAVSADCTDACNNAVATDVTVAVGMWVSSHGAAPRGGPGSYKCGTCRSGHGYGEVSSTVAASGLGSGAAVTTFAVCKNAAGGIVGAGNTQLVWPGGDSLAVTVPVVVNDRPAACEVGASTGW
jgi:hypothetical protein